MANRGAFACAPHTHRVSEWSSRVSPRCELARRAASVRTRSKGMSGLPLTRKMSYSIAAPPLAASGRQALLVQEGWSLSSPSSFGHQTTMHNAIAPSIRTRARDLAKLTTTSQGLTAWGTNPLNVHGAVNAQTPVHKPWHTGQQQHHRVMEDWRQRAGYGLSPRYLQRQRSVFGLTATSEISAWEGWVQSIGAAHGRRVASEGCVLRGRPLVLMN